MQHAGNIRAHTLKKYKRRRERKKQRERENKNALSHARRLVVSRRRDLVGVVRHLVYFLRERERERYIVEQCVYNEGLSGFFFLVCLLQRKKKEKR